MKTSLEFFCFGVIIIFFFSSLTIDNIKTRNCGMLSEGAKDSLVISNTIINSGSKIMTDQDGLVVIVPSGKSLASIELYFSAISTLKSDSSRLLVKNQRSWGCAPLGSANPFTSDQYTLGITKNTKVQVGWNKYEFDTPIPISSDTLFIWPDLIQQINPRVVYAFGNIPEIRSMTGTSCANANSSTSVLDYVCKLTFISNPTCPPYHFINNSDSSCYFGDTLLANTSIGMSKAVTYFSKIQVQLDTTFEVLQQASLTIDMEGCK